jgi:hypothetical protein
MDLVTFDDPHLAKALTRSTLRDRGTKVRLVASEDELRAMVVADRPSLVILVPGRFDSRHARSLTRELRESLPPHGMLLLALPPSGADARVELAEYDGLLALEEIEDDLVAALAAVEAAAETREARRSVRLAAELVPKSGGLLDGSTTDVSTGGAGLLLWQAPAPGPHELRLHRRDGRSVSIASEIAWIDQVSPAVRVGVRFPSATLDQVRALQELALWEIVAEGGRLTMHLYGDLTGATPLERAVAACDDRVGALDLSGITGVDPAGAKALVEMLRALPPSIAVRRVAMPAARLLVRMPEAISSGEEHDHCRVESLVAPFHCSRCGRASAALIGWRARALPLPCPACGRSVLPWRQRSASARIARC